MIVVGITAVLVGSACTTGDQGEGSTPSEPPGALETTGSEAPETSTTPAPLAGPERDCGEHVSGDLGRNWRSQTILVGPVGFVARSYRDALRSDFEPVSRNRYRGHKVLLLVRRGTTVTLTLLPHVRAPRASLLYDRGKWHDANAYRIGVGDTSMTFRACKGEFGVLPHGYTQFNGAFLVSRPGCVAVDFRVAGQSRHYRANLSFGAGPCG